MAALTATGGRGRGTVSQTCGMLIAGLSTGGLTGEKKRSAHGISVQTSMIEAARGAEGGMKAGMGVGVMIKMTKGMHNAEVEEAARMTTKAKKKLRSPQIQEMQLPRTAGNLFSLSFHCCQAGWKEGRVGRVHHTIHAFGEGHCLVSFSDDSSNQNQVVDAQRL